VRGTHALGVAMLHLADDEQDLKERDLHKEILLIVTERNGVAKPRLSLSSEQVRQQAAQRGARGGGREGGGQSGTHEGDKQRVIDGLVVKGIEVDSWRVDPQGREARGCSPPSISISLSLRDRIRALTRPILLGPRPAVPPQGSHCVCDYACDCDYDCDMWL